MQHLDHLNSQVFILRVGFIKFNPIHKGLVGGRLCVNKLWSSFGVPFLTEMFQIYHNDNDIELSCTVVVCEFIGLCGAGCHFSYNPFVADPTFFLIHRYEAIAGEVIFLARWSGSVTESALQGISEKKFGIPLF